MNVAWVDTDFSTFSQRYIIWFLFLLGLLAIPSFGSTDMLLWLQWGEVVYQHGLIDGYTINANEYPPILDVYLWACFKVADVFDITPFYTIKTSFLLFTYSSTLLIYYLFGKKMIPAILFYISTLYTSVLLSYVDVYYYLPFILAFYFLLKKNYFFFSMFYTFAVFTKYFPLIVAPFVAGYVLYEFIEKKGNLFGRIRTFIWQILLPILAIIVIACLFFHASMVLTFSNAFQDPYLSGQALNFNWVVLRVIRHIILPAFDRHEWPLFWSKSIFWAFYLLIFAMFLRHKRSFDELLLYCIVGHMSYFSFNTGVHESHLTVSCVLSVILAARDQKYTWMAVCINLISVVNIFSFYGYNGGSPQWIAGWLVRYFRDLPVELTSLPDPLTFNKYIPKEFPRLYQRSLIAVMNTIYFVSLFVLILLNDFRKDSSIPIHEPSRPV